jgi:AraC-like DNA-binding protein
MSDHIIQNLLSGKFFVWSNAIYMSQLNVVSMSPDCKSEFMAYYNLIRLKIDNNRPKTSEILHAILRALLFELCNGIEETRHLIEDEKKQSQGRMLFNRFLRTLASSEIKRQPISLYASQLAITPKYLTMLCLKYSNKTASDWIVQYTLEDIRYYLRNSNFSIKEVSAKLGFANMSHFGSYVRKHLGASPSDFRRGW